MRSMTYFRKVIPLILYIVEVIDELQDKLRFNKKKKNYDYLKAFPVVICIILLDWNRGDEILLTCMLETLPKTIWIEPF